MKYKIFAKTLQGQILVYTVDKYDVDDSGFVCFVDKVKNENKKFHCSNCEINEVVQ